MGSKEPGPVVRAYFLRGRSQLSGHNSPFEFFAIGTCEESFLQLREVGLFAQRLTWDLRLFLIVEPSGSILFRLATPLR
jgi:hypothetical protein